MPSKIYSAALVGLDAVLIEVEVDLARGLHLFSIVGLPDKAVEEARERVSAAIKNSGLVPPNRTNQRIIVNLAPADLKKGGSKFDLPIALAYVAASRQVIFSPEKKLFLGELALDGSVRGVSGVLSVALMAEKAKYSELYVPWDNREEAALVPNVRSYAIKNIKDLLLHLAGKQPLTPLTPRPNKELGTAKESDYDFSLVRGQEHAKRALEIAAAGGHNILMSGPPGSGKTLLARSLISILPTMQWQEFLEVTKICSAAGITLAHKSLVTERPFRNPHHNASSAALVGGGSVIRPGEITLAHRGVLFLDEFPEFDRGVLESLRQPLEDGIVTVSRAQGTLTFPAKFMLVATMNPCPCGFLNDLKQSCVCTSYQIIKYRRKLSGPLLDRIDLHITVPRVKYEKLSSDDIAESSAAVRDRVQRARDIQNARFARSHSSLNSEMKLQEIKRWCGLDNESTMLMKRAMDQYHLSARGYHRILKLARTIADLAGSEKVESQHVSEALQFRLPVEEAGH